MLSEKSKGLFKLLITIFFSTINEIALSSVLNSDGVWVSSIIAIVF